MAWDSIECAPNFMRICKVGLAENRLLENHEPVRTKGSEPRTREPKWKLALNRTEPNQRPMNWEPNRFNCQSYCKACNKLLPDELTQVPTWASICNVFHTLYILSLNKTSIYSKWVSWFEVLCRPELKKMLLHFNKSHFKLENFYAQALISMSCTIHPV